eukprot:gene11018-12268_t
MTDKPESWSAYSSNYVKSEKENQMGHYSQVAARLLFQDFDSSSHSHQPSNFTFLDVAAGPAIMTMRLIDLFQEKAWSMKESGSGQLLVTDFAINMVEAARHRLASPIIIEKLHQINVTCEVKELNACDPSGIPTSSISHLGCMFGIMFFPQRQVALRKLRELLSPSGRAVFGTWHYHDYIHILTDFAHFVHVPAEEIQVSAESNPLRICSSVEVFRKELEEAGYENIEIVQEDHSFVFTNCDDTYFTFTCSPALLSLFPFLRGDREKLLPAWYDFLCSKEGEKWVVNDGQGVQMRFVANLALVHK